jgi:hypothetical protein
MLENQRDQWHSPSWRLEAWKSPGESLVKSPWSKENLESHVSGQWQQPKKKRKEMHLLKKRSMATHGSFPLLCSLFHPGPCLLDDSTHIQDRSSPPSLLTHAIVCRHNVSSHSRKYTLAIFKVSLNPVKLTTGLTNTGMDREKGKEKVFLCHLNPLWLHIVMYQCWKLSCHTGIYIFWGPEEPRHVEKLRNVWLSLPIMMNSGIPNDLKIWKNQTSSSIMKPTKTV